MIAYLHGTIIHIEPGRMSAKPAFPDAAVSAPRQTFVDADAAERPAGAFDDAPLAAIAIGVAAACGMAAVSLGLKDFPADPE